MGWNLDDYEPVATRLARWLDDCRTRGVRGRVITELMHRTDDVAVFRAEIYEDDLLIAVGHAEDYRAAKGDNATNWFENAETGSIGRALSNMGVSGSDPSRRPSREEMQKASRGTQNAPQSTQRAEVGSRASRPDREPSAAQLKFLNNLVQKTGEIVDERAATDRQVCSQEIERLQNL